MAKYTQNNEGDIILDYFKEDNSKTGFTTCLSIGENDGKTLSNVLELIEMGWAAVLVEPSLVAYEKMWSLHKDRDNVHCFQVAIGTTNEIVDFHESGSINLYNKEENTSLVSTIKKEDYEKWKDATEFETTKVQVIPFSHLMEASPIKQFDFISIDAEGMDLEILKQIDLKEIGCKMLCVEFNWKDQDKFDAIVLPQGYRLIHKNGENLIYAI
jgi:FkbM family methyltransferase